jgi:hypothetical protein
MTMTTPSWIESNRVYTHPDHSGPTVIFAGDTTSGAPPHYAPNTEHIIDLTPFGVTPDATFAQIVGHVVITDVDTQINDLRATFRPVGSTLGWGNYQLQTVTVWNGDGERGNQSVVVPLTDGKFEFYWEFLTAGVPDTGPSTALLNLWLTMWGRNVTESGSTGGGGGTTPTIITVPPEGLTVDFVQGT